MNEDTKLDMLNLGSSIIAFIIHLSPQIKCHTFMTIVKRPSILSQTLEEFYVCMQEIF